MSDQFATMRDLFGPQPAYVSEALDEKAPLIQERGESVHTQATNNILKVMDEAGVDPDPQLARFYVDCVFNAVIDADLTKKKVVGAGKHGMGDKRADQVKEDCRRFKQGRGK